MAQPIGFSNLFSIIFFAGLVPTQYSGGSSIQGKPRIYKRGGKNLRDVLYMCSMNAMKTNAACKALYERLRANGKTGKQALIAVCNKLLKLVFLR
ncbi:MAG: transposase [Chitinophagaceae bacterium]